MALTPLGKALRWLRIDKDMNLVGMADALGVGAAFLSSIETGRKPAPADLVTRLATALRLSREDAQRLQDAADQSMSQFRITLADNAPADARSLAGRIARDFVLLDKETRDAVGRLIAGCGAGEARAMER